MAEIFKVGIADMNVCRPPDSIMTIGLGSCVGIAIRDKQSKVGGLVHVMLPDSHEVVSNTNIAKFADTGIPELVKKLEAMGGIRSRMVAKIAGGAKMFAFQSKAELASVGDRNVEATKKALAALRIPIIAEDTGANYGRTVTFFPETGDYEIKAVGKPVKVI
ncbi:MAG: Chemoreceptor glutamine deamidase CheD [Firmicutes bacterium ADurb.Bin354]|nr:MAG: Chemoreceptor glutamine deamidase CheD [Firmicutes bacterium ADurb.Bin354]SCY00888.1 chemotaxis protein CheD [Lachnospiraceae bacterium XPB1003]